MAIAVHKLFTIADNELNAEANPPGGFVVRFQDVVAALTNLPEATGAEGPGWTVPFTIGEGTLLRAGSLPLPRFVGREARERSMVAPVCIFEIAACEISASDAAGPPPLRRWLWLFREGIWITSRDPRGSEVAEVILRIKAAQFKDDEGLKRLREQVANFEAIETLSRGGRTRSGIPDDVKLHVWSRDGGACVKCGSPKELHFDHVIPHSRGGSDAAENIQLLCRPCNLAKSNKLI